VDRDEIAERIRSYLVSAYPAEAPDLGPEDDLSESVLADSLSIVTVVDFLEDAFSIRVRRADLNERTFRSIRSLSEYVANQTRG